MILVAFTFTRYRLIFGLKSFTLKKLSLTDLGGVTQGLPNDSKLVIIQDYFHILGIPAFPIRRRFSFEMCGEKSAIPVNLQRIIDQPYPRVRGKWYSWTFLIAIGLVVIAGIISSIMHSHDEQKVMLEIQEQAMLENKAEITRQLKKDEEMFDNPQTGFIVLVQGSNPYIDRYNIVHDAQYQFEVIKVTRDSVQILLDRMNDLDNKMRREAHSGALNLPIDSLEARIRYRENNWNQSSFMDSVRIVYSKQEMMQKMVVLNLENYVNKYEIVNISLTEFRSLKSTLNVDKSVDIKAFSKIGAGWVKVIQSY